MKRIHGAKTAAEVYIENHSWQHPNKDTFLKAVEGEITDLSLYPDENANQIRFFNKVLQQLQAN